MPIIASWIDELAAAVAPTSRLCLDAHDAAVLIRKFCPFKEEIAYVPLCDAPRGTVHDWALDAARYIAASDDVDKNARVERIAATIATFAAPLLAVLDASRRDHDDSCETARAHDDDVVCNCGVAAFNQRIDEALAGRFASTD